MLREGGINMKQLLKILGDEKNRKMTYLFLALGILFLAGAFIIGISDNPPGIILCYLGIVSLMLAFVHHWRTTKKFLILLLVSIIGFPVFAILHNVFYALGQYFHDVFILNPLFIFLEVLSFLIAILICPPGILIGAIGSIVLYFKNKNAKAEAV